MTILEIKHYIYENMKIEFILERIGCHHIKFHTKGYYTCANKDGDNITAINIYNDEYLTCINYTRKLLNDKADLITLVQYNMNLSFSETIKYLHNILGLKMEYTRNKIKDKNEDPLYIFKKFKKKRFVVNSENIEIFNEDIIREYTPLPHILWVREGILPFTCDKFKIGYSSDKKRIVIPERWWCGSENDFIGVMGRTVIEHYDMLDIPKYFPLKSFSKSLNIYGLQENYDSIQKNGYVVIGEAQKSVLKRHSRKDETIVSIGSHNISDEQVSILIGLNVEIVIALDKGIDINHVRDMCEKFYGIRKVSYIFDRYDLLKNKDAPMDLSDKLYKYLFKYRTSYNEKEHAEYLNYQKKERE